MFLIQYSEDDLRLYLVDTIALLVLSVVLTSTVSDLKALSNIGILKKLNTTSPLISGGNDENQDRLGVF